MARLTDILVEENRQEVNDDKDFLTYGLYFFELGFPAEALGSAGGSGALSGTSYLFPLVINPQSLDVTDIFTAEFVPTAQGGLYVEENGIQRRELMIRGTTGFQPKRGRAKNQATVGTPNWNLTKPSFNLRPGGPLAEYSGQRHFHFLQDRVFRIYGELKRDPRYAKETYMNFINTKDGEAWRIIPTAFTMSRSASRNNLYQYAIRAVIVDKARLPNVIESYLDPRTAIDQFTDAAATAQRYANLGNAAVNDVTGVLTDLDRQVNGALSVINNASSIIRNVENSVGALESGLSRILTVPLSQVRASALALESLIQRLVNLPGRIRDNVAFSLWQLVDTFDGLSINTDLYASSPTLDLSRSTDNTRPAAGQSNSALTAAANSGITTLAQLGNRAHLPAAGDLSRQSGLPYREPQTTQISGEFTVTTRRGDTLSTLASKYLGTPGRWRELAVLNNLRYPYISESGAPGTVVVGDEIRIPSNTVAPEVTSPPGIIGVPQTATVAERLLGRDFKIEKTENGEFDFVADPESDNSDVKTVAGVANLQQALAVRILTTLGENPLFPNLGMPRVIGNSNAILDREIIRLRIRQAVENDPRINSVLSVTTQTTGSADQALIDYTVSVRGFSNAITVEERTEPLVIQVN